MADKWIQEQLEEFQFDFDRADKDKNGSLSFSEVYIILKAEGFKGTEEEAMAIFENMDKDGNKSISRAEFTEAIKNLPKMGKRELRLRKMFLAMDRDGNGFLTKREIANATNSKLMGMNIPVDKISELLVALCKDEDGKLDYDEFLRVYRIDAEADEMRKIFKTLDADGSGYLTAKEIYKAVSYDFELKLPMDKVADLSIFVMKDDDKKISYEEFIRIWLKQKDQKKR